MTPFHYKEPEHWIDPRTGQPDPNVDKDGKYIHKPYDPTKRYPRALHAPDGTTISVASKEEHEAVVAAQPHWKDKPHEGVEIDPRTGAVLKTAASAAAAPPADPEKEALKQTVEALKAALDAKAEKSAKK